MLRLLPGDQGFSQGDANPHRVASSRRIKKFVAIPFTPFFLKHMPEAHRAFVFLMKPAGIVNIVQHDTLSVPGQIIPVSLDPLKAVVTIDEYKVPTRTAKIIAGLSTVEAKAQITECIVL